ncbi:MAG: hypothetical protein QOJ81_205 [Chloroflexota bacterium]|jgi:hypothetical protein|nr:hypothetical protein [Chloroflexota bacterium]
MRNLTAAICLLVAACSTSLGPAHTTPNDGPTAAPSATPVAQPTDTPEAFPSLAPGAIRFRVVNLYRDPAGSPAAVDVYVRTQGLVQAAPARLDLPYGESTDYFSPPDPGSVVVTAAGAGDPTCVISCPHFIVESSTNFGEGDARTIILYGDGSLELWHNPEPGTVGTTGNALAPADPSAALLFVVAVAVPEADFGLRLGFDGVSGCQLNRMSESVLIGGNQIAVFAFPLSAEVLLYDTRDPDCAQEPVGGPFEVSGAPGSRTLLILFGALGSMDAVSLDI